MVRQLGTIVVRVRKKKASWQWKSWACAVRSCTCISRRRQNCQFTAPKSCVYFNRNSTTVAHFQLVVNWNLIKGPSQLPTALLLLHCQLNLMFMLYHTLKYCRTPLWRKEREFFSCWNRLSTCWLQVVGQACWSGYWDSWGKRLDLVQYMDPATLLCVCIASHLDTQGG